MTRRRLLKRIRKIWAIAGACVLVLFPLYLLYSFRASAEARLALESGGGVQVQWRSPVWRLEPSTGNRVVGLIFLPGALVEPAAYAPLARSVAARGYPVRIVTLPWRMFGPLGDAEEVFARVRGLIVQEPLTRGWVLAGHSKGGALAADFASRFSSLISGLILIGTSHPRQTDLSRLTLPVLKIYGTRDGLASPEEVKRFARNLPSQTRWVQIRGGNHAQFGSYGSQLGDRSAEIPRQRQQARTLEAILQLLQDVEGDR